MTLDEMPFRNTKRKVIGKTEEGFYIFGEPEPLEKTEEAKKEEDQRTSQIHQRINELENRIDKLASQINKLEATEEE